MKIWYVMTRYDNCILLDDTLMRCDGIYDVVITLTHHVQNMESPVVTGAEEYLRGKNT